MDWIHLFGVGVVIKKTMESFGLEIRILLLFGPIREVEDKGS